MEIPPNRWNQLEKLLLHPMAFSSALEAWEKETGETPRRLWRLVVSLTLIGAALYGFTAGLLVDSWPLPGAILLLLSALAGAWFLFLKLAAIGTEGPPPWLRLHYAVVAMLFGELAFEGGIVLNLLFWWTDWLSEPQAKSLVIVWFFLASLTMLSVLVLGWRSGGHLCGRLIFLWLLVFQGAVIGTVLVLGPVLGIRF